MQLQVDAPGFIADLFSSDEFQAEAEAETAAMVARSAELATADAEMMRAETARACAADEAQQAKAEAEAVRAEMEMERAQAQAEAAATVKAMAACISELEVSPADAVDSSSVGTQCGTRAAKVRVSTAEAVVDEALQMLDEALERVQAAEERVEQHASCTDASTSMERVAVADASTCHYLLPGVGLLDVGVQADSDAEVVDASSQTDICYCYSTAGSTYTCSDHGDDCTPV